MAPTERTKRPRITKDLYNLQCKDSNGDLVNFFAIFSWGAEEQMVVHASPDYDGDTERTKRPSI